MAPSDELPALPVLATSPVSSMLLAAERSRSRREQARAFLHADPGQRIGSRDSPVVVTLCRPGRALAQPDAPIASLSPVLLCFSLGAPHLQKS